MKAMLVLYGIPQFVEVPLPPPIEVKLVVADPTDPTGLTEVADQPKQNIIIFKRTGVYLDKDIPKVIIYQAI